MPADTLTISLVDPTVEQTTFPAMGGEAHVVLNGSPPPLLTVAQMQVDRLEQLWSRFLPDSEISRVNRAKGVWVEVSEETMLLVEHAITGWWHSGGRFDPSVLRSLELLGYDRTLEEVGDARPTPIRPWPAPGLAEVRIDRDRHRLWIPLGTAIDPGGLGKGLAADLVAEELVRDGAAGALVNLSGDLRVAGRGPDAGAWGIEVQGPDGATIAHLGLTAGGVATTTDQRRRWTQDGEPRHHLIDPRTGHPADSDLSAVTVIAGTAWWAEVMAKSAYLAGREGAPTVLAQGGATGLLVDRAGSVHRVPGVEDFLR